MSEPDGSTVVERIAVGTGSPEGTNSAYALPDRRAVIDPGPPGDGTWTALTAGMREADLPVRDVEHVLVTHWHVDHAGLAVRLADAAGAELHLHEHDAPLVGDYAAARERRLDRDARRLREWGVPDPAVDALIDGDSPSPFPETFPVTAHADGDEVAGLRVVHAPGHTLGHAAFRSDGHLFVGDAVLPTYTPNVGGSDTRVADPLRRYLETLDRLESLDGVPHPGHGTSIELPDDAEAIRAHHRERADRVLAALGDRGRATPWVVARDLFGDLSGIHVKFGAGEAAAHLARLRALGAVERIGDEPAEYAVADDVAGEAGADGAHGVDSLR